MQGAAFFARYRWRHSLPRALDRGATSRPGLPQSTGKYTGRRCGREEQHGASIVLFVLATQPVVFEDLFNPVFDICR